MTNDQLRAEHAAGSFRSEIAIKYGLSVRTVYGRCTKLGLKFASYWTTAEGRARRGVITTALFADPEEKAIRMAALLAGKMKPENRAAVEDSRRKEKNKYLKLLSPTETETYLYLKKIGISNSNTFIMMSRPDVAEVWESTARGKLEVKRAAARLDKKSQPREAG